MMGGENDVGPAGLEQQRREMPQGTEGESNQIYLLINRGIIDYKSQQQYTSRPVKTEENEPGREMRAVAKEKAAGLQRGIGI